MKKFQDSPYAGIGYVDLIIKLIERHARPTAEIILDDVDLTNLLMISRRGSLEYRKKVSKIL